MDIIKTVKPYTPSFFELKNNKCIRVLQTYPEINAEPLYIVNFYDEHVIPSSVDGKNLIISKKTKQQIKPAKVKGFNAEQLQEFFGSLESKKLL